MRINAFYSVFGHPWSFEKSLKSIIDYVERVIVVYGPYIGFPLKNFNGGKDEYVRVCEKYGAEFFEVEDMTQSAKRSLCFELITEGEYVFIIDDDEICVGDVEVGFRKIREHDEDFGLIYVDDEMRPDWRVRIMKCRKNFRYGPRHWEITNVNTGEVVSEYVSTRLPSFYIHDFKIYNMRDEEKDGEYVSRMCEYVSMIWEKKFFE